jgi:hypothetical protein
MDLARANRAKVNEINQPHNNEFVQGENASEYRGIVNACGES